MARNSNDLGGKKFFSFFPNHEHEIDPNDKKVMEEPGIKNFFKLFGRRFSQIVSVNLLTVVGNFPLLFLLIVATGYFSTPTSAPALTQFPLVYSAALDSPGAFTSAILGDFSIQTSMNILSVTDYVLLGLAGLVFFTFGPVMVGTSYILRNIVKQEPIFLIHDFFYAIKRNIKQGIIFGIIDLIFLLLSAYNLFIYGLNFSQGTFYAVLFFAMLLVVTLYLIMRMYIYTMMLTFDLSILKLLKNSLLFSVLGIKRNALAIIATVAVIFANFYILILFMPLGIILPFVITISFIMYISTYCAFPVISKYMIEPYYDSDGNPRSQSET